MTLKKFQNKEQAQNVAYHIDDEILAAEKRLNLSLPISYQKFLIKHAGELAPLGVDALAGLWLSPEELVTGEYWPGFHKLEKISEEPLKKGDIEKWLVIHQSHHFQYFLVLDYRLTKMNPSALPQVLLLKKEIKKEKNEIQLIETFDSFDAFLEALNRHKNFRSAYLINGVI